MSTRDAHEASPTVIALQPGEGDARWFLGALLTIKSSAATTDGSVAVIEHHAPQGHGSPLHVHHNEDEWFYVTEGELTFWTGGQVTTAPAGSFVYLPRDVPHTFVVEGDRPARMLTLLTPGGGEGVFVEGGRQPDGDGLPPATPPDIEKLKQVSARFGAEIVGPPIAPRGLQPSAEPR